MPPDNPDRIGSKTGRLGGVIITHVKGFTGRRQPTLVLSLLQVPL